jgi:hypothetical protein
MPSVEFEALPDAARVWVFAAAAPVTGAARELVFQTVDAHLVKWKAHGVPLVCARDWRDDRFLAVAVDERATNASGCSIDGMFRKLVALEPQIGSSLVAGHLVFWRDAAGTIYSAPRPVFAAAAHDGTVSRDTLVFDTTIDTVGAWRTAFEKPARESWHGKLFK